MIKRTLTEMGCPFHILDDLMENCHECRWPPGLCSLETRQNNRRQYENYVCKRVPGEISGFGDGFRHVKGIFVQASRLF